MNTMFIVRLLCCAAFAAPVARLTAQVVDADLAGWRVVTKHEYKRLLRSSVEIEPVKVSHMEVFFADGGSKGILLEFAGGERMYVIRLQTQFDSDPNKPKVVIGPYANTRTSVDISADPETKTLLLKALEPVISDLALSSGLRERVKEIKESIVKSGNP